ncbi:MAG: DUF1854 domain-containing protein [Planctomycetota bacterium]|jgi:hypothetical protein|nr:DUF1854 domain-containing protein [Planctomycetota bacterium]
MTGSEGGEAGKTPAGGRLWRESGRIMYQGEAGGAPVAVRVRWARPLSDRGGAVSLLEAGRKREAAWLPSLDLLPEEGRRLAREELELGLILPRILRIHLVTSRFGNYYWDVTTDSGRRKFLLASPESNSFRPLPDAVVIKDVFDNCYEINPISGLDPDSRREMERAL